MRGAMPALFQTFFADALLDAGRPLPPGIAAHDSAIPARRFAVYRNNVVAGLGNALKRRYPVLHRLVGEEFFVAMARQFVSERPPRSPLLLDYGDEFADFIAGFEPARELPYLADVARLEAARSRAYHAEDAIPLSAESFAALDTGSLHDIRITLHPSVEIVRSDHPIVTIWAMNSGEQELGPIKHYCGEDALIARPRFDVEVRTLPPGGAVFLIALAAGASLRDAAEAGVADDPDFDLTSNLAGLIGAGLARGIVVPEPRN